MTLAEAVLESMKSWEVQYKKEAVQQ